MGKAPDSFDKKTVIRAQIAVFGLSIIGIGAFGAFWILLGEAGIGDFVRLIAAFCMPPALIAAIIGAYKVLRSPGSEGKE